MPALRERMVAKKGHEKAHHFGHYRQADCDPDRALHTYAIKMIHQGHTDAVMEGRTYGLTILCDSCSKPLTLALTTWDCAIERSAADGTRADILFSGDSGRRLVVEVVCTHPPEEETLRKYKRDGIRVAEVNPTWEDVTSLMEGIVPAKIRNFANTVCGDCRREERIQEEKRQSTRRAVADSIQNMRPKKSAPPLREWTVDRYGQPIYPHIQRQVFRSAQQIISMNWRQTISKPYLFIYPIPPHCTLFLDFGSSDVVPIWEDTSPLFYWRFSIDIGDHYRNEVEAMVFDRLNQHGVRPRTSFFGLGTGLTED